MSARRDRSGDAPLLAWGEALRTTKMSRARLTRRAALVGGGLVGLLVSAALPPSPRLVWNASDSAPRGLYRVAPGAWVEPGDMVVARLPARYRRFAAERHYLPLGVPLVKRVAAYGGDEVCALGTQIFINAELVATRPATDRYGRALPAWTGCTVLRGRQVFLLMDAPASFDGRYFGPTEGGDIIGKAHLLWGR